MKTQKVSIAKLRPFLGDYSFYVSPFLDTEGHVCVTDGHFLLTVDRNRLSGEIPTEVHRTPLFKEDISVTLRLETLKAFIDSLPKTEETRLAEKEDRCPECEGNGKVEYEYRSSIDGQYHYVIDECPICHGTGLREGLESLRTGRMIPDPGAFFRMCRRDGNGEKVRATFRLEYFSLIGKAMELFSLEEVTVTRLAPEMPLTARSADGSVSMLLMPCLRDEEADSELEL